MISKQIALYLQGQSLGTVGTDLFYGFLPATPNTLTVIYDTGGDPPDARLSYDYPTIQVRVREAPGATSIEDAYSRILTVYNVLQSLSNVTLSDGTLLVNVQALQSSPISLDKDDMERAEFTQNYRLHISKKTNNRE